MFPADAGSPSMDIRGACADLLRLVEEHNLTNAAVLEAHRRESQRERIRAEAIHAFKASPHYDIRALHLLEEPLQRWVVRSDAPLDPQAFILAPESVLAVARVIIAAKDHYQAGKAAALAAVDLLRSAHAEGRLRIHERELPWLDTIQDGVEGLPDWEGAFIDQSMAVVDTNKFLPAEYEL